MDDRYDDIYEMIIEYKDGTSSAGFREMTYKESVTKFVDEAGTVREDLFNPSIKQAFKSLQNTKKQN